MLQPGGIIGLGEADDDRIGLLHTLATLPAHPESVPINALVAVKGTPLEDQKVIIIFESSAGAVFFKFKMQEPVLPPCSFIRKNSLVL